MQKDVADGPSLAQEGFFGFETFQGLQEDLVAFVEAGEGGIAALQDGLTFFRGQGGLHSAMFQSARIIPAGCTRGDDKISLWQQSRH